MISVCRWIVVNAKYRQLRTDGLKKTPNLVTCVQMDCDNASEGVEADTSRPKPFRN
jgi:hypothetical protein